MTLKYKNYIGQAEWDDEAKIYHGRVIGVSDVITFVSEDEKGLKQAFHDSVKDYIDLCKEVNKIPERSRSGQLRLRISPDIHAKLAIRAAFNGMSLNAYAQDILDKNA